MATLYPCTDTKYGSEQTEKLYCSIIDITTIISYLDTVLVIVLYLFPAL